MDESNGDIFAIDEHNLVVEWQRQPKLFHLAAIELADAKEALRRAEAVLDVCRAETELAIRENPDGYKLQKATEATVDACCRTQQAVIKAAAKVRERRHDVDIREAAVSALEHRKRGLQDVVQLYLADYFSAPRQDKPVGKAIAPKENHEDRPKTPARKD